LLLEAPAEDLTSRTTMALQTTMQLWPLWLGACAIALGALFGWHFHLTDAPPAVVIQPTVVVESAVSGQPSPTAPGLSQPAKGAEAKPSVVTQRYVPAVQPGDDQQIAWGYFAIALTVFVGCAVGFVVFRLRKSLHQVSDSTAFVQALRIWTPVVQQWRSTPRAIKRFGNRVRYLAMLQQSEGFDESGFDEFRRRLPAWLQRIYTPTSTPTTSTTTSSLEVGSANAEHRLVALGALHAVYGTDWRQRLIPSGPGKLETAVDSAIERYTKAVHAIWPPTDEELDIFERSLKGVRLPGDVEVLHIEPQREAETRALE